MKKKITRMVVALSYCHYHDYSWNVMLHLFVVVVRISHTISDKNGYKDFYNVPKLRITDNRYDSTMNLETNINQFDTNYLLR